MKTITHHRGGPIRSRARAMTATAVALALAFSGAAVVATPAAAVAPFPVTDTGAGAAGQSNPNWKVLSSDADAGRYTADGRTRLSTASTGVNTNLVNETAFPSSTGFQVEFDYRMAGGALSNGRTGDGLSVYLIDGDQSISSGGTGSGLAYANGGASCGVAGGYLGVGLDVYGNFASGDEQNEGGPGASPSMVGLRGSGEPCSTTAAYPWITGSTVPALATTTSGDPATSGTSTYRRVRISIEPDGAAMKLTVAMTASARKTDAAGAFSTVLKADLSDVAGQAPLPASLKLGFGASTGNATNYMDVRQINVRAFTDAQVSQRLSPATPGHAGFPAASFVPGDSISFEAIATNNGPTIIGTGPDGVAVLHNDLSALPLENVSWTCAAAGGATCVTGGGTGAVVTEDWTGPAGSSVTVTVQATVAATSSGTYTSTAIIPTDFTTMSVNPDLETIHRDGGAADTDLSNNTAAVDFDVVLIPDAASSTIEAQPSEITADGSSTVTVALLDANGTPLTTGGATVAITTDLGELTAVTDNGDGTYSATLSGRGAPGTASVGFSVDGVTSDATATVAITSGAASPVASTIEASSSRILGDGSSTITVTTFDASGNQLTAGGATITMTTDVGTLGPVTDNGDGTYSAVLSGGGAAGTATIGFTVDDEGSDATAEVEILAAAVSTSTIAASPTSIVADGVSTSEITVTLRDALGNPVTSGGTEVAIELLPAVQTFAAENNRQFLPGVGLSADATPTLSGTTDNGDGTYTAVLTSPLQTGSAVLGFTVESVAAASTDVVTFTPQLAPTVPGVTDLSVPTAPTAPTAPTTPTVLASTGAAPSVLVPLLAVMLTVAGLALALGARAARDARTVNGRSAGI